MTDRALRCQRATCLPATARLRVIACRDADTGKRAAQQQRSGSRQRRSIEEGRMCISARQPGGGKRTIGDKRGIDGVIGVLGLAAALQADVDAILSEGKEAAP